MRWKAPLVVGKTVVVAGWKLLIFTSSIQTERTTIAACVFFVFIAVVLHLPSRTSSSLPLPGSWLPSHQLNDRLGLPFANVQHQSEDLKGTCSPWCKWKHPGERLAPHSTRATHTQTHAQLHPTDVPKYQIPHHKQPRCRLGATWWVWRDLVPYAEHTLTLHSRLDSSFHFSLGRLDEYGSLSVASTEITQVFSDYRLCTCVCVGLCAWEDMWEGVFMAGKRSVKEGADRTQPAAEIRQRGVERKENRKGEKRHQI